MAASVQGRCARRLTAKLRSCLQCKQRAISHGRILWATHDVEFDKAKQRLNSLKEDPGNVTKLQMYALFKQATVGKCNVPKPGMMDFVGKAKWDAWNGLGDLSQDDAQLQYIKIVEELVAKESPASETSSSSPSGKFSELIINNSNGIYAITLNRPKKKNAINYEMYEQIQQALKEAEEDKSVIVASMTGAGNFYCSGNDLGNFANVTPDKIPEMARKGGEILKRYIASYIDFPKPLVGLINGPAVGVSVTVLGLYDAVYAVDSATFHTPFTALGQSAEGCSSYIFPKLMGAAKANEMLMFNRKLTAAQAYERGLVSEVFTEQSFSREVQTRLQEMGKLPPQSLWKSKKLVRDAARDTLHAVNARECEVLVERWQSEECMNAIMKFFQKS
ncbi:enoyl-CoA delta isomerase 2-like [Liolophura sinensis]|uniref:enoyl-CoA delta isomerase 2-like n=1 Tax=Liolophura sinensis TaxID=3198878 RepID=UPI0031597C49